MGRSITWRSLLLGTAAVGIVCGITPYNDFVLSDTHVTAGYLPLVAVMIAFVLVVAVNGSLHRFLPRHALSSGELAVVLLMTLVAASVPNWGLMRFLVPMPVAPFHLGTGDELFWRAFLELDLPPWLFPVSDVQAGRADPVAEWFYTGVPEGEQIPYRAWLIPLLAWGVFAGAMMATLVAIARLVMEQWAVNERLPFPLVQVQLALIEAPNPGKALNALFRSRMLWLGLAAVFCIHSINALNVYLPRYVPEIPLGYDLSGILTEEPFVYLRGRVKTATLFFALIGLTYFIRLRAAFSLWGIYLLVNLVDVQQGLMQSQISGAAWADQNLGASAAFVLGILWIGRRQWARILKNAVGIGPDGAYRLTFWIAVGGTAIMIAWLCVVGVQFWMAGLIVLFILMAHLVVARVVAETGLPLFRSNIAVSQVYSNLPAGWFSGRDIYFAGVFTLLGPLTTRDGLTTTALNGMTLCDKAEVSQPEQRRLGGVIAWTLVLGFVLAAAVILYSHYSYSTPMSRTEAPQRNNFGAVTAPHRDLGVPFVNFSAGRLPPKQHNSPLHMSIGFCIVLLLQAASLRWISWPLLPVGYVTSHGAFIASVWFSIFIGWLVKALIVRFGGSSLYTRAKPLFVGIIFGEALAAGTWLLINAGLVLQGGDSQSVRFLP